MSYDIETIVIGAGVVGLATARALAVAGQEVMVLEKAARIGAETSSHNSEVIHAGLYYKPGSLKARFCVAGKKALYRFCAENGVAVRTCGKLVVAHGENEIAALKDLAANAAANGVDDLTLLDQAETLALEPALACSGALLSPSTGVVDSHGYLQALEGHLTAQGGQVVLNSRVTAVKARAEGGFAITLESGGETTRITAKHLVNAASFGASAIGRSLAESRDGKKPGYEVPGSFMAKGHYFQVSRPMPFKHLIYPMPDGTSLGRHLTFDCGGKAKLGPDFEWVTELDYSFEDPDGARQQTFFEETRRYWPSLEASQLSPDYTGIRPKIHKQGELPPDFAVHGPEDHGHDGFFGLYGFESPGLTSSLAIGDYLTARLLGP